MIVANWPIKILAVALALILFVFNRMNNVSARSFSIQVQARGSENSLSVNIEPKNIKINLRGEDYIVNSIADSDIEAYIDLTQYQSPGKFNAHVFTERKGSALGAEPLEITIFPLEVTFELTENEELED